MGTALHPMVLIYNLNLIGVTNGKSAPLTGSDRHTIFVPLYTNGKDGPDVDPVPGTDIWLTQGPFAVCDEMPSIRRTTVTERRLPNQGAVFQLPCNTNITTATGTTLFRAPRVLQHLTMYGLAW